MTFQLFFESQGIRFDLGPPSLRRRTFLSSSQRIPSTLVYDRDCIRLVWSRLTDLATVFRREIEQCEDLEVWRTTWDVPRHL